MADVAYRSLLDPINASYWNTIYTEAERRIGKHYSQYSPFFWINPRFLARRRVYIPGSTPLKQIGVDTMLNMAEWFFASAYAGFFLNTSEPNDFFRFYDNAPFDAAVAAATLTNSPKPGDPRPCTSSIGPTALINQSVFTDALTSSIWPISGSESRLAEYVRSFWFWPFVAQKAFTFGPEYSGSSVMCSLVTDGGFLNSGGDYTKGSVNDIDVGPVDSQPFMEFVHPWNMSEWCFGDVGGSWDFPYTRVTKERFFRFHNFDIRPLGINFAGTVWYVPAGGCLAVRRNTMTQFVKCDHAGNGSTNPESGYWFRFQEADPCVLHPTQIVGPPLVDGSALDQNGNNITDPLMLVEIMYYLFRSYYQTAYSPTLAPVYYGNRAWDMSAIYNSNR
jgi:hypothetical protein